MGNKVSWDINEMVNTAEQYMNTSIVAFENEYYKVAMTNASFAEEVLLKTILYIKESKTARGHDLTKLFKKLPNETKEELKNSHKVIPHKFEAFFCEEKIENEKGEIKTLTEFEKILEYSKDEYVKYRYAYELPQRAAVIFGSLIRSIETLKTYVEKIR